MKSTLGKTTCLVFVSIMLCCVTSWAQDSGPRGISCYNSRLLLEDIAPLEGSATLRAEDTPLGPPDPWPHEVGEAWDWYLWQFGMGPPTSELKRCTIRGRSDHAYMVVEDDAWNAGLVDQHDVDVVLEHFETSNFNTDPTITGGIYPLNVEAFGDPPTGLDQDPRIYIMYYETHPNVDGMFWFADPDPQGTYTYESNECEVVYLNCQRAFPERDPENPYMLGVLAHEFEHLIHYSYDRIEEPWQDEGLAEYAMFRFGAEDPGHIASFLANPDVELVPVDPANFHYGAGWFFYVYLGGQYGGPEFTRTLVEDQSLGIAAINNTLAFYGYSETFDDVFADWTVANLIDDPSVGAGEYGYADYDFNAINITGTHAFYPVGSTPASVSRTAADYFRFEGYPAIQILFDGADGAPYALSFVEIDQDGILPPRVTPVTPDAQSMGTLDVYASSGYEVTVMVPGAMASAGSPSSYVYRADVISEPITLIALKDTVQPKTDLTLQWTGGLPPFALYRGLVKDNLVLSQSNALSPLLLQGELEALIYYSIE